MPPPLRPFHYSRFSVSLFWSTHNSAERKAQKKKGRETINFLGLMHPKKLETTLHTRTRESESLFSLDPPPCKHLISIPYPPPRFLRGSGSTDWPFVVIRAADHAFSTISAVWTFFPCLREGKTTAEGSPGKTVVLSLKTSFRPSRLSVSISGPRCFFGRLDKNNHNFPPHFATGGGLRGVFSSQESAATACKMMVKKKKEYV